MASRRMGETKRESSERAPSSQMRREGRQNAKAKSPRANIIRRHGRRMGEMPSPSNGDEAASSWSLGHQGISWPACWRRQRDQDDDALERRRQRDATRADTISDRSSSGRDDDEMMLNKCHRKRHFVARSTSIVIFAIFAQLISLNQQIATSNAHQTNQPQPVQMQQHHINTQQPRHWRNGSFIVSDLINQARGQQVEESSQKQATTMKSVDNQQRSVAAVNQQPAMVSPPGPVASARSQATAATPSESEFELSDSTSGTSTPATEEMAADEEHEEAGADENENGGENETGGSEDQTADANDQPGSGSSAPPQIDRRRDDSQPPADTFEGIQLRPSRQSHTAGSEPNGAATLTTLRTMAASRPTETTPTSLVRPRPNGGNSTPVPPTTRPNINPLGASFDVNMGADRMLIKPADELETRLLLSSSPSPLPPASPGAEPTPDQVRHRQVNNFDGQVDGDSSHELAHESVIHNQREMFDGSAATPTASNATAQHQRNPQQNDQHQVMLATSGRFNTNFNQQFIGDSSQTQHELALASICYTPLSLLLVILATILITLLISMGAYHLFKYLKRHQFDLVANSKHFDHKHLSSSSNGYSQGATTGRSLASAQSYPRPAYQLNEAPLGGANATSACTLHLLQADGSCQKCRAICEQQAKMVSSVSSYAFRNPYFTDDQQQQVPTGGSDGRRANGSLEQRMWPVELADGAGGLPKSSPASYLSSSGSPTGFLVPAAVSSSEQMHFIESHIADLHNRQVTSSVKELSSFGVDTAVQVVDLTSAKQQDRVRAHPKEGDLVAIDLTGHDIIGLGFDVCGNQRDGIFVRSVSSHGPARESGCIQAGDRIKCINVSFESVTLQDACDILNAGAPYKLRLLVEKKIATMSELDKMQNSSSRPTLNQSAEQQRRRPMMMMQANNAMGQHPPLSAPDLSHRTGPLEATRNHLGRWLNLLTGNRAEEACLVNRLTNGRRQHVEDEFQLHNQRAMTMANNPLLMMSQYKQALPAGDGGDGHVGSNLYKLSPIGALATGSVGLTFGPGNSLASSHQDNATQLESGAPAKRASETSSIRTKNGNETPPREARRKYSALSENERDKMPLGDVPKCQQTAGQPDQDQKRRKARPRVESCHSNGAFYADEVDGQTGGDDRDDDDELKAVHGGDKYLHRGDSSVMENVVCLHDEDYDNVDEGLRQHRERHQGADHEQDAEGLNNEDHDNDEHQSKLVASGEKFNTKSRLTM